MVFKGLEKRLKETRELKVIGHYPDSIKFFTNCNDEKKTKEICFHSFSVKNPMLKP